MHMLRSPPAPDPTAFNMAGDDTDGRHFCPDRAAAADAEEWRAWDDVDLVDEAMHLPSCEPRYRGAHVQSLRHFRKAQAANSAADPTDAAKAWKLFLLAPRMLLLARTKQPGSQGRAELLGRAAVLQRGNWLQLMQSASAVQHTTPRHYPPDEVAERQRHQACARTAAG